MNIYTEIIGGFVAYLLLFMCVKTLCKENNNSNKIDSSSACGIIGNAIIVDTIYYACICYQVIKIIFSLTWIQISKYHIFLTILSIETIILGVQLAILISKFASLFDLKKSKKQQERKV